jgi:hypothetical protein
MGATVCLLTLLGALLFFSVLWEAGGLFRFVWGADGDDLYKVLDPSR